MASACLGGKGSALPLADRLSEASTPARPTLTMTMKAMSSISVRPRDARREGPRPDDRRKLVHIAGGGFDRDRARQGAHVVIEGQDAAAAHGTTQRIKAYGARAGQRHAALRRTKRPRQRHGAPAVGTYREEGYLPEAMRNYLLRLCWSHGDDEIISRKQAVSWFSLDSLGRSPSRFDMQKMLFVNAHYMRATPNEELIPMIKPQLEELLHRNLDAHDQAKLLKGLGGLKERSKDLNELASQALLYTQGVPYGFDEKAQGILTPEAKEILKPLVPLLQAQQAFDQESLESALRAHGDAQGLKFGQIAQPLRVALTGRAVSPGIFEIMEIIGQKETLERLNFVIGL